MTMPHTKVRCDGCGGEFTVEKDQESARCPSCGTRHGPPWEDPETISYPVTDAEPQAGNGTADAKGNEESDATLQVSNGATVRITIEVLGDE